MSSLNIPSLEMMISWMLYTMQTTLTVLLNLKLLLKKTISLQNEKIEYKLVGKDEADLKNKLIFFQSPIGKGLIGKNKNDLVEITTPSGIKNFEIIDVKYI